MFKKKKGKQNAKNCIISCSFASFLFWWGNENHSQFHSIFNLISVWICIVQLLFHIIHILVFFSLNVMCLWYTFESGCLNLWLARWQRPRVKRIVTFTKLLRCRAIFTWLSYRIIISRYWRWFDCNLSIFSETFLNRSVFIE